jgi:hypothetical protein
LKGGFIMAITVGVYLGKKDRFLRNWYDILPRGQFPVLVKYCIQSYLKGMYFPLETICDIDQFQQRLQSFEELAPTQRNVTFTSEDGSVYEWVESLENGYRSEEIKNILKETIIHTLMGEQERKPVYPQAQPPRYRWSSSRPGASAFSQPAAFARTPENDSGMISQGASMYPAAAPDYRGSAPYVNGLKREMTEMKDPYEYWDEGQDRAVRREGEAKEGASREFSNLVNRMG